MSLLKHQLNQLNFRKSFFRLLIILILLPMLIGPARLPVQPAMLRVQPELMQAAAQMPGGMVSVIIQKAATEQAAEQAVARLGGKVTLDLSIINGFAADVPVSALAELGKHPGVRWVSLDAPVVETYCTDCVDAANLKNAYIKAIQADKVWSSSRRLQGSGIGIAVVDSGINPSGDLYTMSGVNRITANVRFNSDYNQNPSDGYGHGTHVSSIAAGDGSESNGQYIGVAPLANIINVKVSNDDGSAAMKDVVAGLQWILSNKQQYNIRVVNLSLNSSVSESYHTSPLNAAVEILWFNGIVVVVSAGNQGSSSIFPPANDPFVITVGAVDDKGTAGIGDDVITSFSAFGKAENGTGKPDIVAPGRNIIARLVNSNMGLANAHPDNKVQNGTYFRMSGTSMAAPMVSGGVALLLQSEPNLTPDQVKFRLKATANKKWSGYNANKAGAGYLNVNAAVNTKTTESANTGQTVSNLLTTGNAPMNGSVSWNSVSWNSVSWNSVSWNSVSWNSVSWNSDYWE